MKVHCVALVCFFVFPCFAHAGVIKLEGNFYADRTVTFSNGGFTALIEEDLALAAVILSNDPGLGDPVVIDTRLGTILRFEYDFIEGMVGAEDEFGAFVIDPLTGLSAGPAFEFFSTSSSSGTVVFDLSSLGAMPVWGLHFQLGASPGVPPDMALDSTVTVSNVQLNSIPEPGSLAIWALLAVVAGVAVRRNQGWSGLLRN